MNKIKTWFNICVNIRDGEHTLRIGLHNIIGSFNSTHFHECYINTLNTYNKIPDNCMTLVSITKLFTGTIDEYNKPKWDYHKRFNNKSLKKYNR